jgi:murein L,D-transpeptidase YafK
MTFRKPTRSFQIIRVARGLSVSKIRSGFLFLTILFSINALWAESAIASPKISTKDRLGLVPATIVKWPENGSNYIVLVDKSAQKILLYRRNNPFAPYKIYRCSTGENDGAKTRKNDRKTPEGIYFFTKSYVEKELSSIYGVRAFPIDYPNVIDKKKGRKGYGIWFHGTNEPLKPRDTNGCIVLDNRNIDQLATFIKLHDTPIVISPKMKMIRSQKLEEDRRELEKIVEAWKGAWEKKEINRYMSFYSPRFFSAGGKNWDQWKRHKTQLAKRYKQIMIEIEDLQLLKNDGVVLARFHQRYSTAGFRSQGEKRLYLEQNSNQWKIVGEVFNKSYKKRIAPRKQPISPSQEIMRLIYLWREAWEQKDIKTYISCYDPRFRARGMDRGAWKEYKENLNRRYRSLKIDISNLKLDQVSNRSARITFKQDYRADIYHDYGLKKMFLTKEGEQWRIRREEWHPLSRKPRL